jgi:hypothetical protein
LLIFKHEGFVRQHYVHPKCLGFSAFALDERICVHLIPHDFQGLTPWADPRPFDALQSKTVIGKIARPKDVRIVPDMPKTRSGKIMRRVLSSISNAMDIGDVTTLANPEIVEEIRIMVQGEAKVATKAGLEDIKSFGQE